MLPAITPGLQWGLNFNPHTHPIPIPMGIPMGIPIPTAALNYTIACLYLVSVHQMVPPQTEVAHI